MDVADCFLDGNADVVEFCPHESFQHLLAAATYTLEEGDHPSRSGSISLFDVNADAGGGGGLDLLHRVETAGIFDMKWNPVGENVRPLLAQADADGHLRLHRIENAGDGTVANDNIMTEVNDEKISSSMCLCLDWNPLATSISVGLSDGSISVVSFLESQLEVVQEWKAHEFEVWATCFDHHQPNLVYTGSDDCKFSGWDLRSSSDLAFQNSRAHKMGVCCISKSLTDPHMLLTGSYDEYLRIWDVRSISKPVNETSICLGGGVWRIKQHPFIPGIVLAACMHNGFAVVKIKGDGSEVIETYSKHESLAYGADWQKISTSQEGEKKSTAVGTCSFYDRCLRIWVPESNFAI
ncbi:diphthine methyltransferase-like [Heracleum sosnowskyi]|uniref:methylated diphthine methylhydrolase n=1 Tax=Heracleum sosnowskyi TaxID=360622 RepID=A0AAD8H1A7_9APIA|nr:diphthine methyltransferase-like [Heracleum sosnowskyi]